MPDENRAPVSVPEQPRGFKRFFSGSVVTIFVILGLLVLLASVRVVAPPQ